MSEQDKLKRSIEMTRARLQQLICDKKDLLNPVVIWVSKKLDMLLNEYYKLVCQ